MIMQAITLDFEQFASTRPSGNNSETSTVTSVLLTANPLPDQLTKPGDGPQDIRPPRRNILLDLQSAAVYLQNLLRKLDSQFLALDNAYRSSKILIRTYFPLNAFD
jgi:hypothetical protein